MKRTIQCIIFALIFASSHISARNRIIQKIHQKQNQQLQPRTIIVEFLAGETPHRFPFTLNLMPNNQPAPPEVIRAIIRNFSYFHVCIEECNGECYNQAPNN